MIYNFRRQVEDIVEALKGAKQRGQACSLLIGAGCSVEGGIPTAGRFVDLIKERYPRAFERAATKTYPACMAELSIAERHSLIAEQVDAAQINWAHIGIALLMQHGYVDRILTTNFDPLIIRACAMLGEFPAVYDFAASQEFKPDFVPDKAVFYLHGQRTGFRLMNTPEEVDALSRSLAPVFQDAGRGRAWVVAGYSGDNDPVFEQLANVPQFDHQLFWVGYKDDEPNGHVRDRLLVARKFAFFVGGHTADSFFVELTQQLEIFPPAFVARPFTHLAGQLELLAPYTPPGGASAMNVLNLTREWIAGAQRTYEPGLTGKPNHPDEDVAGQIIQTYMEGGYDRVIALAERHRDRLPPEVSDSVAWAYVMFANRCGDEAFVSPADRDRLFGAAVAGYARALQWKEVFPEALFNWGVTLIEWAGAADPEQVVGLIKEAEEKYAQAVLVKPGYHEALNNWGGALVQRAQLTSGEDAKKLLQDAEERFAQAVAARADSHEALYNWGNALGDHARLTSGVDAGKLLREAEEKYAAAVTMKPDKHEALVNWGASLVRRAELSSGEDAEALLKTACEKYAQAVAVNPDSYIALNNWGDALVRRALMMSSVEGEELLQEAAKKYAQAVVVKPDGHDALNKWGVALAHRALLTTQANAEELLQDAEEKYEQAVTVEPDSPDVLYNWGTALAQRAALASGPRREELLRKAEGKYAHALMLEPDKPEALENWGNALVRRAQLASGAVADGLLREAGEKYAQAVTAKSDSYGALNNWGSALAMRAKLTHITGAEELLREAEMKFAQVVAADPHSYDTLSNWGAVLAHRADLASGASSQELLREAEDRYFAAEKIVPGVAAYNIACLRARLDDQRGAQQWLHVSADAGSLPSAEHLRNDQDLDSLRGTPWFQEFVDSRTQP